MTAKPLRSRRRARAIERTREDIIEAAARVFAAEGHHGATMQAIAREAGFTAASLYTYFKSKDEIAEALVEDLRQLILALFDEPSPAGLTLAQRLELLLSRQVAVIQEHRHAFLVAFEQRPRICDQHEIHEQFVQRFAKFIESGPERLRCTPMEAARLIFGSLHAFMLPWLLGDADGPPGLEPARAVDLLLNGVARPARPA